MRIPVMMVFILAALCAGLVVGCGNTPVTVHTGSIILPSSPAKASPKVVVIGHVFTHGAAGKTAVVVRVTQAAHVTVALLGAGWTRQAHSPLLYVAANRDIGVDFSSDGPSTAVNAPAYVVATAVLPNGQQSRVTRDVSPAAVANIANEARINTCVAHTLAGGAIPKGAPGKVVGVLDAAARRCASEVRAG